MYNQKKIILIITSLICGIFFIGGAKADFDLATSYYQNGKYAEAYKEFLEAAKYGDHSAQYNIGVMYIRGEYVEKDLKMAYAWLKLAAQYKEEKAQELSEKIYSKLTDINKNEADSNFKKIYEQYNETAVDKNLSPNLIFTGNNVVEQRSIFKIAPTYPEKMLKQKKDGVVDVIFSIDKDGTTRDHIVYRSTSDEFTVAALIAVRQWKYEPLIIDGSPKITTGKTARLHFALDTTYYGTKRIDNAVATLKEKAKNGNASDKLDFGYFLSLIPYLNKNYKITDNSNEWYEKSAIEGDAVASYFLGLNTLNGNMCSADSQKAMGWLLKAAKNNMIEAQYTLAMESFTGAHFEKNDAKGFYWLRAAAQYSQAAQLRLAWILSTHPDDSVRNLEEAKVNLAKVDEKLCFDKQTLYQTQAAVAAESGNFKNALKWEKSARDDAKRFGLPTTQIELHLQSYKNKKPWREEL